MKSKNFPCSRGCKFVGSKIRIIIISIKQMLVYTFVGMYIPGQGLPMKAKNIGTPRPMMISQ